MSDRDYYEIIGLTPGADGVMVDQAYWHLARKYQALAETSPEGQRLLNELNEAYGVLGNPRLREQYDAFRDDVLITRGMVKPVKAKTQKRMPEPAARERAPKAPREIKLPSVRVAHWRTYGLAAIVAALAFAGAWTGVNVVFVIVALGAGLALALSPTVQTKMSDIHITVPTVSLPQMSPPRVNMPQLPEIQVPGLRDAAARDEPLDADVLRASTAATIARWRATMGLKVGSPEDGGAPSNALVEIVESEREIEEESEPLSAVLDILRGSRRVETP